MSKKVEVEGFELDGLTKIECIVYLAGKGFNAKEAVKFYDENKPARKAGFAARFYAILEDGVLSEADFKAMLADESENVQNHESHYGSIRELTNAIWDAK